MSKDEKKTRTFRIKRDIFQKFWNKGIPLFFFNKIQVWNNISHDYDNVWKPENVSIENVAYDERAFSHTINDVAFIYAKPFNSGENSLSSDLIEVEYEDFNPANYNHVRSVFLFHLFKSSNAQDIYACRELLWYLNNYFINHELLVRVLEEFDEQSLRPFFIKELSQYALCLSIPKQKIVKRIITHFGGSYTIYLPSSLSEALKTVDPDFNIDSAWKHNIFDLVWKATVVKKNDNSNLSYDVMKDNSISNFFLQIRRWLVDIDYSLTDYEMLMRMLRLFSPDQQMIVLNRYFLAIKKGQTSFDVELLKKFKENKFDKWGVYYHSTKRGSKPVLLGLQLLCDNILTFFSTKDHSLQTINGTLDIAYSQCNVNNPSVDFQLDKIVPVCTGGAIPNKLGFKGFICYEIIQIINDETFNDDKFIAEFTLQIINTLGSRRYKYICAIHGDEFSSCEKFNQNQQICNAKPKCEHHRMVYLDRWSFNTPSEEKCNVVNIFLKSKRLNMGQSIEVTMEDINMNIVEVRQKILEFLSSTLKKRPAHGNFPEGYIYASSSRYEYQYIYRAVLKPVWMVIEPRNNAYIGLGLVAPQIGLKIDDYGPKRETNDAIKRKETDYLKPIIISSIQSKVGTSSDLDGKFYLNYDEELLRNLQATFYSTRSFANGDDYNERGLCFLQSSHTFYKSYCAPEYKGGTDMATNLPYFWCRGRECYMNALSEQTLATCKSWEKYSIFHILEILGYPQINKTAAGFEPTKLIRDFIGMVNKAAQLFRRVICRECGHILFPVGNNNFNQYNNFVCLNPICSVRSERVYLSQCFHCKSGMIDSRDSQVCPNGLRICPICLSCCTDEQIEFQAQKYIRIGRSIPEYIQRRRTFGHNNKKQYFCPKCGGEIVKVFDAERNETHIYCHRCNSEFPKAVEWI